MATPDSRDFLGRSEEYPPLPPGVMNLITRMLIERAGIDPELWVEKYAEPVRILVEGSSDLRRLVVEDPSQAVLRIEEALDHTDQPL